MRIMGVIVGLVALLVVAVMLYIRLAPMPADRWHVDPVTAQAPDSPNHVLLTGDAAPVFEGAPEEVAARLDAAARADGASLIAGDLADGFATYVARTPVMGYPDAVSIRLSPAEGEATRVEVFSRSRFGYSDMGVNLARISRWTRALVP